MKTEQPKALRLANALEWPFSGPEPRQDAAAELRRLHAANQELLETLKLALEALNRNDYLGWQTNIHVRQAIRAAIAKGEQA